MEAGVLHHSDASFLQQVMFNKNQRIPNSKITEVGLKLSNTSSEYGVLHNVNELLEFDTTRTNVCWISAHWRLELHVQAMNANIFQTAMS